MNAYKVFWTATIAGFTEVEAEDEAQAEELFDEYYSIEDRFSDGNPSVDSVEIIK